MQPTEQNGKDAMCASAVENLYHIFPIAVISIAMLRSAARSEVLMSLLRQMTQVMIC